MANALITGVSGLNSHQRMLEVIGNNLANLNTTAYKTRRTLFSDLLYETVRAASGSSGGNLGGVNPAQVGSGSRVARIDMQFAQGNFETTGGQLDFALQGNGFFIVDNGTQNLYTRAGAFGIDDSGTLIDPATGYRVQRFGTVGEPDGINPAFQIPGDSSIRIPLGAVIPGGATSSAALRGNLPSTASGPNAQVISSFAPWTSGGGTAATAATLLNSLDQNAAAYATGDSITITGTDHDGSPVSVTLAVDATTTLGDLVTAVDGAFGGATAALDADGRITLTSDSTGESFLSLSLADAAGNTGGTDFSTNPGIVSTSGSEGDMFPATIEVFDERGGSHFVNLVFTKQADDSWNVAASLNASDGTIVDGSIEGVRFNADGSFASVDGTGTGDANLIFQFTGIAAPQSVAVSFGQNGGFDGMTELAMASSLAAQQDGFPPGNLVAVQIRGDGTLEGVSSNGRTFAIAQLAIASFLNPNGLASRGDNYYESTLASGDVEVGAALSGSRGSVRGGQLEQSNVDIALEFTRLIVAQRGFSANARTIRVTDQVLEELTNLIR
jgi:flagellar hook protein FlgE